MVVSKNRGTPKSSISIGVSIIFTIHFGGHIPLFLETPKSCMILPSPQSGLARGVRSSYMGGPPAVLFWILTAWERNVFDEGKQVATNVKQRKHVCQSQDLSAKKVKKKGSPPKKKQTGLQDTTCILSLTGFFSFQRTARHR